MHSLARTLHAGLVLILAGNLVVILTWPLQTEDNPRRTLDPLYSAFCHRIPERCYELGGEPLPACARCLGIWLGLLCAASLAAVGRLQVDRRTLKRAMLFLAILAGSWLLGVLVLPAHWHLERTLAGWLGGIGLYVLLWALLRLATKRALDLSFRANFVKR